MRKSFLPILSLLFILGACKKDIGSTSNPFTTVTESITNPASVPATAAGSLYASSGWLYNYYGSVLDSSKVSYASAWFGNVYNPIYAGSVIVNNDTLADSISYPWGGYYPTKFSPVIASNTVNWSVSGNTTDSIPAFNHTENIPFPVITGLSIPAIISAGSGITLNYKISGTYDYLYFFLDGGEQPGKSDITFIADSLNTASFSTSQINQVIGQGALSINVYAGKFIPYTIAGKTFYFVKESLYQLNTTVR